MNLNDIEMPEHYTRLAQALQPSLALCNTSAPNNTNHLAFLDAFELALGIFSKALPALETAASSMQSNVLSKPNVTDIEIRNCVANFNVVILDLTRARNWVAQSVAVSDIESVCKTLVDQGSLDLLAQINMWLYKLTNTILYPNSMISLAQKGQETIKFSFILEPTLSPVFNQAIALMHEHGIHSKSFKLSILEKLVLIGLGLSLFN